MQKPAPVYVLDLVLHPEHDSGYVHFENADSNPFEPTPSSFPRVNIWWLADSALATYWDEPTATAIFASAGLQCMFVKEGSTDCYLAWQDEFVIVAFRGTEPDEWEDMLTDVKIKLVPWQLGGSVHRGFKTAVDRIWPKLESELKPLSAGRTVWFCGHSLGAALATLAAHRYQQARGVCTFGCPRVGDATFASAFNTALLHKTFRHVNHHDVVTHVPPPLGYKHVEVRRFISPNGTISGTPSPLIHFFAQLVGTPDVLLETIKGLERGTLTVAPNFLLEHMPKAYAIWTWNDYDANQ